MELKNIPPESPEGQGLSEKYKFFYFSRYTSPESISDIHRRIAPIDSIKFGEWKATNQSSHISQETEPYPTEPDLSKPWFEQLASAGLSEDNESKIEVSGPTFDEIVELISSGKPVPGIRQIPDMLSSESPSISTTKQPPKKPWETES